MISDRKGCVVVVGAGQQTVYASEQEWKFTVDLVAGV